jgi:hypothetical protein
MDPGAVFLICGTALLFGDVSLRSPGPYQLTPLENPHQIVHEILGVAVPVDLLRLGIFQPVPAPDEGS